MMKKLLLGFLALVFVLGSIPAKAIEGTATISAQDLYSLAQRKSYRLGLRLGSISPTNAAITSPMEFALEFDAKLNENVDSGPRFGVVSYKDAAGTSASVIKFGFGGRIYLAYWGEVGSTHGFFNAYLDASGDYYTGNNVSSFGGNAGAGIELAFGPNSAGFGQVSYTKISGAVPLDGLVYQVGARLAFM